jgi:hypothetical protein
MSTLKYPVEQIVQQGVRCTFSSNGSSYSGWIMPEGYGVGMADPETQLTFEPASITTDNGEALFIARSAVAEQCFAEQYAGKACTNIGEWFEEDGEFVKLFTTTDRGQTTVMEAHVGFRKESASWIFTNYFDQTAALSDDSTWEPAFSPWRHGGWYVSNNRFPNGSSGCVSNNFRDGKWRIVCDNRRTELDQPGDYTFKTRDEAARAERSIIRQLVLETQARRVITNEAA